MLGVRCRRFSSVYILSFCFIIHVISDASAVAQTSDKCLSAATPGLSGAFTKDPTDIVHWVRSHGASKRLFKKIKEFLTGSQNFIYKHADGNLQTSHKSTSGYGPMTIRRVFPVVEFLIIPIRQHCAHWSTSFQYSLGSPKRGRHQCRPVRMWLEIWMIWRG